MPWEPLDHTADAGVMVTAGDRDELFVEALRALTGSITELDRVRPRERRAVSLAAPDLEQLLVEWLSEALYLFDAEGWLAADARLTIRDAGDAGLVLAGELRGEPWSQERHPAGLEIKAVTYHALEVRPGRRGWWARVIFDI